MLSEGIMTHCAISLKKKNHTHLPALGPERLKSHAEGQKQSAQTSAGLLQPAAHTPDT